MNPTKTYGHRVWFFPDGDLPPAGNSGDAMHGHESLILLNPNEGEATVVLTVYYEEREADTLEPFIVKARRVRCVRTNEPIGGYQIALGQYALKIESSVPIICQLGRADTRQPNLAYYTTLGFPAA
jgi:hypothetical protein